MSYPDATINPMRNNGSQRADRLTLAALIGAAWRIAGPEFADAEAIDELHEIAHLRGDLLSRAAGHYAARLTLDRHDHPRIQRAIDLLIAAGGTDRELGLAERDAVIERASQKPPDATRIRKPGSD